MQQFPHHYEVRLARDEESRGTLTAPPRPALTGGPPPEFGGNAEWWSPEHLLLAAASLCLMTTYQALATRAGVSVSAWDDRVHGILEKTATGIVFTSIRHEVKVRVAPIFAERARELVDAAKRHCIVANSLRTPTSVDVDIEVE